MSTKDDFKVIEFDVDTTNPRKVTIAIICNEHDLDGTDLLDAIEHLYLEMCVKDPDKKKLEDIPDDKH